MAQFLKIYEDKPNEAAIKKVVDVLKNEGLEVAGMVSIFTYGFQVAADAFIAAGIIQYSLTNYGTLIELAIEKGIVTKDEQNTLLSWRQSPSTWNNI